MYYSLGGVYIYKACIKRLQITVNMPLSPSIDRTNSRIEETEDEQKKNARKSLLTPSIILKVLLWPLTRCVVCYAVASALQCWCHFNVHIEIIALGGFAITEGSLKYKYGKKQREMYAAFWITLSVVVGLVLFTTVANAFKIQYDQSCSLRFYQGGEDVGSFTPDDPTKFPSVHGALTSNKKGSAISSGFPGAVSLTHGRASFKINDKKGTKIAGNFTGIDDNTFLEAMTPDFVSVCPDPKVESGNNSWMALLNTITVQLGMSLLTLLGEHFTPQFGWQGNVTGMLMLAGIVGGFISPGHKLAEYAGVVGTGYELSSLNFLRRRGNAYTGLIELAKKSLMTIMGSLKGADLKLTVVGYAAFLAINAYSYFGLGEPATYDFFPAHYAEIDTTFVCLQQMYAVAHGVIVLQPLISLGQYAIRSQGQFKTPFIGSMFSVVNTIRPLLLQLAALVWLRVTGNSKILQNAVLLCIQLLGVYTTTLAKFENHHKVSVGIFVGLLVIIQNPENSWRELIENVSTLSLYYNLCKMNSDSMIGTGPFKTVFYDVITPASIDKLRIASEKVRNDAYLTLLTLGITWEGVKINGQNPKPFHCMIHQITVGDAFQYASRLSAKLQFVCLDLGNNTFYEYTETCSVNGMTPQQYREAVANLPKGKGDIWETSGVSHKEQKKTKSRFNTRIPKAVLPKYLRLPRSAPGLSSKSLLDGALGKFVL